MIDQRLEQRLHRYLAERVAESPPIGMEQRIVRHTLDGRPRVPAGPFKPLELVTAGALILVALGVAIAILQTRSHAPVQHPTVKVRGAGVGVCYETCSLGDPVFVSRQVGWLIETTSAPCNATCPPQTSVLFRTDDGGHHWEAEYTWWHQAVSGSILASPDGRELLIAPSSPAYGSSSTLYSSDGGASWSTYTFPSGVGKAVETACKVLPSPAPTGAQHLCGTAALPPLVFFLNTHDGWLLSQKQTYNLADLFRTTDGGAHWQLVAPIDVKAQFNLDPITGLIYPNGVVEHGLQGQLLFQSSSVGWFIAPNHSLNSASLYRSPDGGATWRFVTSLRPPAIDPGYTVTWNAKFFNSQDGIVELLARSGPGPLIEIRYVYRTADGGTRWSSPIQVPQVSFAVPVLYVDAAHWVGWPAQGGWIRTADAGQHWDITRAPQRPSSTSPLGNATPVPGGGLPGNLDQPLSHLFFLDASQGWAYLAVFPPAGGRAGETLYQTTDGGVDWTPLNLPELQ